MFVGKKLNKHHLSAIDKNCVEFYAQNKITLVKPQCMKTIALSICVLFSLSFINAQNDSSVHGLWKIVSIKLEDVYFNLKTDSISLPNEMKNLFND